MPGHGPVTANNDVATDFIIVLPPQNDHLLSTSLRDVPSRAERQVLFPCKFERVPTRTQGPSRRDQVWYRTLRKLVDRGGLCVRAATRMSPPVQPARSASVPTFGSAGGLDYRKLPPGCQLVTTVTGPGHSMSSAPGTSGAFIRLPVSTPSVITSTARWRFARSATDFAVAAMAS